MKIAICEDDEKQREEIKKICDNYFAGINQAYEYNEYAEGETLLKDERKEIDLLFLDIDLGTSMDGIAVMNELEKSSSVKKILFISSHHQAVWDSFGCKSRSFTKKRCRSYKRN